MFRSSTTCIAIAVAAVLAACGGGSSDAGAATGNGITLNSEGTAAGSTWAQAATDAASALVNPIVAATPGMGSPDPSVVWHDGHYYYCRVLPGGALGVAKAQRLQDIGRAPMTTVWTPPATGRTSRQVWAPELQYLRGRWTIYFTASDDDVGNHRMYALLGGADDPLGPYEFKGKVAAPTDLTAIDGIAIEHAGALYFVWSGWRRAGANAPQVLYIAPMSDPWTISGERHEIGAPQYAWESVDLPLMEGPAVLYRGGRIHLVYSASASWSDEYALGVLSFSGGDILDARSWTKQSRPLFSKRPEAGAWGPGHNSFVKSPDGTQDWIVYHAIDHQGGGWLDRSVRAQPFGWTADGLPDFGRPAGVGVALAQPSGTAGTQH